MALVLKQIVVAVAELEDSIETLEMMALAIGRAT